MYEVKYSSTIGLNDPITWKLR